MGARTTFITRASSQQNGATAGAVAASEWLSARGLTASSRHRWHAEIALSVDDHEPAKKFDEHSATRFHMDIYSEEWGFYFCHGGRASWIRITDIPFVHGRDDFNLLALTPPLLGVGSLIRSLEAEYAIRLRREHALIRTNFTRGVQSIRSWLMSL